MNPRKKERENTEKGGQKAATNVVGYVIT